MIGLCLPVILAAGGDWPLLDRAEQLPTHDGHLVRVQGMYRALPKARRMGREPVDFGHAAIVVGDRSVQLGTLPRPPEERARLLGERVVARGRLVMRPPLPYPPYVAQPLPPPTLELYGSPVALPSDAVTSPMPMTSAPAPSSSP
jgi:hypothetical protein